MNKKTICISGGFDPLHIGTLLMIKDAATYGKVIVILNSDLWLDRKRGYHLQNWQDRAEILKAIRYIDDVVSVEDANGGTVEEALRRIKPDYFGVGADKTPLTVPERKLCEEIGVELVCGLGGEKIQSSSQLIDSVVGLIMAKLKRW